MKIEMGELTKMQLVISILFFSLEIFNHEMVIFIRKIQKEKKLTAKIYQYSVCLFIQ